MNELRKGNLVLLKRPLADLLGVVEAVSSTEPPRIMVRYLDAPRDEELGAILVLQSDVLKLSEDQEKEMPGDLLASIEKQRSFVFREKSRKVKVDPLGVGVAKASDDVMKQILDILSEG